MAQSKLPWRERLTLSPREAAELLGVSDDLVRKEVEAGGLPHLKMGERILIPRAALEALVAAVTEERETVRPAEQPWARAAAGDTPKRGRPLKSLAAKESRR